MEVDYFEEAVDFLSSLPEVDASDGVGVCGISKGGEIAFLMSAFLVSIL
jgi:cephalosporin-C deacetylase-like acetyl esterase